MVEVRGKSTFFVSLHYAFETADKMYLVMDYIDGGDLFVFLFPVCFKRTIIFYKCPNFFILFFKEWQASQKIKWNYEHSLNCRNLYCNEAIARGEFYFFFIDKF